jgi:hypothetical protein
MALHYSNYLKNGASGRRQLAFALAGKDSLHPKEQTVNPYRTRVDGLLLWVYAVFTG